MILPVDFLDKWHHKFEQKYKMDPNFIYKTNWDESYLLYFEVLYLYIYVKDYFSGFFHFLF